MDISNNLKDSEQNENIKFKKIKLFSIISFIGIVLILIILSSNLKSTNNKNRILEDKLENNEEELTSWEKYIKAEKHLYIWEYYTPDYILQLCQDHHFTQVYLSIGCIETFWEDYYSKGKFPASGEIGSLDYETFIKKLNDIGVEVELVTFLGRDPNNFNDIDRVTKVATMVKELSKKVQIKALHFDQEPGKNNSYENLLKPP